MVKKANELWSYVMRECLPKNRQHIFCKFLRIKYHNDVTKAEFSAHQKYIFYDILQEGDFRIESQTLIWPSSNVRHDQGRLFIAYFWDPKN